MTSRSPLRNASGARLGNPLELAQGAEQLGDRDAERLGDLAGGLAGLGLARKPALRGLARLRAEAEVSPKGGGIQASGISKDPESSREVGVVHGKDGDMISPSKSSIGHDYGECMPAQSMLAVEYYAEPAAPMTRRKSYPTEQKLLVDAAWVDDVIAKLEADERNLTWLATKVNSDRSMISKLLGPAEARPNTSALVGPISEVLGIPLPITGFAEGTLDDQQMLREAMSLTPDDRKLVRQFIARLRSK